MPSRSRGDTVIPEEVGVYHCWSRCVRRSFLCGQDPLTGHDYEYRRDWICQFEETLASLFSIEIGFHGELSNHVHLVLRNRPDVAETWSDAEVARRWLTITHLVKSKHGLPREITEGECQLELKRSLDRAAILRRRLADPSWFMASLCEHVARRCNAEDDAPGHFWEDRYKCRFLANEASILICGIYVDLNQIRAGEAATPEASTHTSAYDRIRGRQQRLAALASGGTIDDRQLPDGWLCELTLPSGPDVDVREGLRSVTGRRASDKGLLSLELDDYLALLDASGRIVKSGKSGSIPQHLASILERLQIRVDMWSELVQRYHRMFGHIVGTSQQVLDRAAQTGRRWLRGQPSCGHAFG